MRMQCVPGTLTHAKEAQVRFLGCADYAYIDNSAAPPYQNPCSYETPPTRERSRTLTHAKEGLGQEDGHDFYPSCDHV